MLLIYVLFVTVARAAPLRRCMVADSVACFLSSVQVKAEAETGKCACARQQLLLHKGSGAQTAVSHVEMWEEEEKKSVDKKFNMSLKCRFGSKCIAQLFSSM